MTNNGFEPQIVAFCCNYCAFAAADLAGSMRLRYPSNVLIVKVPCTGRVDILHVLRAFERGVDGVMVAGCLEGSCHYLKGNLQAKRRVRHTKDLLDSIGVGGERLEMFNFGASDAPLFAQACNEMTQRARDLGPSPLKAREGVTTA